MHARVELLKRLTCREPGRADTSFTTVSFPRGDLTLQARCEELVVRLRFRTRLLGETLDTVRQGRCLPLWRETSVPRQYRAWFCRPPWPTDGPRQGPADCRTPRADRSRPAQAPGFPVRASATSFDLGATSSLPRCTSGRSSFGGVARSASDRPQLCRRRTLEPTRTRSRSAWMSIRRPITSGCVPWQPLGPSPSDLLCHRWQRHHRRLIGSDLVVRCAAQHPHAGVGLDEEAARWVLRSAGEETLRQGRIDRLSVALASGSVGLRITTFAPSVPRNAWQSAVRTGFRARHRPTARSPSQPSAFGAP